MLAVSSAHERGSVVARPTADGHSSWDVVRRVVMRGQFSAIVVLPLCLIGGTVVAGGGLLVAGFAIIALPLMLVLAVPPLVGRYIGRVGAPGDLSTGYCVATIAQWCVVVPIGFLLTSAEPAPLALRQADPTAYRLLADVCLVCAPILWVAQTLFGIRARTGSRER